MTTPLARLQLKQPETWRGHPLQALHQGRQYTRPVFCTTCGIDLLSNDAVQITHVTSHLYGALVTVRVRCDCTMGYDFILPLDGPQRWEV